jgi:hypothetical protein
LGRPRLSNWREQSVEIKQERGGVIEANVSVSPRQKWHLYVRVGSLFHGC